MTRRFHPLPLLLLALGLAAAACGLVLRYRTEAASRSVALVLDYAQFRALSAGTGTPLPEAYRAVAASGVTGMAVTEETLADLYASGSLQVRSEATRTGTEYRVAIPDDELRDRVFDYVANLAPGATERPPTGERVAFAAPGGGTVYVPGRFEDVRLLPTGLSDGEIAEVRAAGLRPIGRVFNTLMLTAPGLAWELRRLKEQGITTLIFGGEEVLGHRGLTKETARHFRELGLLYGSVEFGKQRGDDELSRLLEDRLLRVHSISAAEMTRLPPGEAIERYVRAAVERNIRVNYVRLPGVVTERTFADSTDYLKRLARALAGEGFGLSPDPVPFGYVWPNANLSLSARGLMGVGVGAAVALLLAGLFPLTRRLQAGVALALGAACGVLVLSDVSLALQLVALVAAVTLPTLAFVLFPQPVGAFEDHEHAAVRFRSEAFVPALAEFAAVSAVTLAGAVLVAGLLSELPFLVKIRAFAGIKAATVLPLLLIALIYLTGLSGEYGTLADERAAVLGRLRRFFAEPVRVWHAVALLVGLAALALLVLRSGNDPGVGVSDLELRFRSVLDRVLGVRPRTKEFLLGHPLLLLAFGMIVSPRWRPWAFPLMLAGVIGQVGMLNSFCHLHSPLKLTVLRTVHGLWLGGLLGLAVIWVWTRVQGKQADRGEPLPG
jgi:hypothetical protein